MSLRFIEGPAGSGKTALCLQEIKESLMRPEAGRPLYFLLPDQATYQVERALCQEVGGFTRLAVVSFPRLARMVLREVGGAERPVLSELGKGMLLQAILDRRSGSLRAFARQGATSGLAAALVRTIAECRAYACDSKRLREAAAAFEQDGRIDAAGRLADLALLMDDLEEASSGLLDPARLLEELAQRADLSERLAGSEVWVDGFSGFTGQEYLVLEALMRVCRRVTVTLCLDPAPDRDGAADVDAALEARRELFEPTIRTRQRLRRIAQAAGVEEEPAVRLTDRPRFTRSPLLGWIESQYGRGEPQAWTSPAPGGVTLLEAADRTEEIEAIAAEIRRLCREEGMRYREMAVIVRNLSDFEDAVEAVFGEHDIPFFIDRRAGAAHHPLIELFLAALDIGVTGWSTAAVLRYLRTGLCPVDRTAVDRLHLFAAAQGIEGEAWIRPEPWRSIPWADRLGFADAEIRELDRCRKKALAPLEAFAAAIRGGGRPQGRPIDGKEAAACLWSLLESLQAEERLQAWAEAARRSGEPKAAQEHLQVWESVIHLLEQLAWAFGGAALEPEALLRVVETGAGQIELGLIPPTLDQVLVGAVDRSRQPDLRAVFLAGVEERRFPKAHEEDPILLDADREALAELGVELRPSSRALQADEDFLAYIALTRASERLHISWAAADERGRPQAPSKLVRRVRALVPQLRPESPSIWTGISKPRHLAGAVGRLLQEGPSAVPAPLAAAFAELMADPAGRRRAAPAHLALEERSRPRRLDGRLARRLFGTPFLTSISGLERFAACPFAHFAERGLRLRPSRPAALDAATLGSFAHAAMRRLTERMMAEERRWTPEKAEAAMDAVVDELAETLQAGGGYVAGRHRYAAARLKRELRWAARAVAVHYERSAFRPAGVEVGFGDAGPLPGWQEQVGDDLLIVRGRIDRIDEARLGGRRLVAVIDYKRRGRRMRLADLIHGVALQLPVYLRAAVGGEAGAEPAAVLYMPLAPGWIEADGDETEAELAAARLKALRSDGWIADDEEVVAALIGPKQTGSDPLLPLEFKKDGGHGARSKVISDDLFERILSFAERQIRRMGEQILDGRVEAQPFRAADGVRACAFCDYHSLCGFDVLLGDRHRPLPPLSDKEALERIAGADSPCGREEGEGP